MGSLPGARNPSHKRAVRALQRAEMMLAVSQMAREHKTQAAIAKETGLGRRTVIRYLAERKKFCLERSKENTDALIAEQLDRYNDIYAEAMAAWRRSQEDKKTLFVEDIEAAADGNGNPRKKKSIRTENQSGESAYLEKALSAVAKICELKGLNAPKQTELTANLAALSIHEEIITVRCDSTAPDASEVPGQPSVA